MSDLVFMERVARWLTNTQVRIKADVADSNTQAQRLVSMLDQLERRIDACRRPNLDKEVRGCGVNKSAPDLTLRKIAILLSKNCQKLDI